jgi:hypothetical protein
MADAGGLGTSGAIGLSISSLPVAGAGADLPSPPPPDEGLLA